VFYDLEKPLQLPEHLKATVDRIIIDPPFLSEDCQTKMAITCRMIARKSSSPKLIICTGERMETLLTKTLYKPFGLRTTDFVPIHPSGLSNEFYCYANFECKEWKYKETS